MGMTSELFVFFFVFWKGCARICPYLSSHPLLCHFTEEETVTNRKSVLYDDPKPLVLKSP